MTNTPRPLIRRPARVVPVTIVAILLVAIGGLGAWLVGTWISTGSWPAEAGGAIAATSGIRVGSPQVLIAAAILVVLGLVLVLAALIPGRRSRVEILRDGHPGDIVISTRDLAQRIRMRTEGLDGVHSARAQATDRQILVTVRTVLPSTDSRYAESLRDAAQRAAEEVIAQLRPATPIPARVRIQHLK